MQILLDIPDTEIPIERAMDTMTLFFKNGHVYKCKYPFKELPKGHWIDVPHYKDFAWYCSECERFTTVKHNYCPNCGAKMVEPQETEDKE